MTAETLEAAPPNAEEVVVAWLSDLGRAGVLRRPTDELPFRLVHRVSGADDVSEGYDEAVVSVHTFAASMPGAIEAADATHQRMMYLAKNSLTNIELSDGTVANVDYCRTEEKPTYEDFKDPTVFRYVARYRLGLSFTTPAPLPGS